MCESASNICSITQQYFIQKQPGLLFSHSLVHHRGAAYIDINKRCENEDGVDGNACGAEAALSEAEVADGLFRTKKLKKKKPKKGDILRASCYLWRAES